MERERIEVPVKLLRDEVEALTSIIADYHRMLARADVPVELANLLVLDFHAWMLEHYRLVSERQ